MDIPLSLLYYVIRGGAISSSFMILLLLGFGGEGLRGGCGVEGLAQDPKPNFSRASFQKSASFAATVLASLEGLGSNLNLEQLLAKSALFSEFVMRSSIFTSPELHCT
jgi:hypothetical protein